jgi:hypothetical protein
MEPIPLPFILFGLACAFMLGYCAGGLVEALCESRDMTRDLGPMPIPAPSVLAPEKLAPLVLYVQLKMHVRNEIILAIFDGPATPEEPVDLPDPDAPGGPDWTPPPRGDAPRRRPEEMEYEGLVSLGEVS